MKGVVNMLDFIFNRKYLKAKRELEEEIAIYKGMEQHYIEEIRLSETLEEYKIALAWYEHYRFKRDALEDTLRILKYKLH
jgi:hypothetical protein